MQDLDVDDVDMLTAASNDIRRNIEQGEIDPALEEEIILAYKEFSRSIDLRAPQVAVRSSATAEDLPDASFAGQQDTYLHIAGKKN